MENKTSLIEMPGTQSFRRKIKCPRHFLIHPSVEVFLREPVPELKNVSDYLVRSGRARKTRIKRDIFGNKMLDWQKIYDIEKQKDGRVIQPQMDAGFIIEQVWDPKNPICVMQCKGRCKRGKGNIREMTIKRLHG